VKPSILIVLTTVADRTEAETLAEKLVKSRLAACVQILPAMTSVYYWEDKVQKETEHLLLIKSLWKNWDELRDFITRNHSYKVPEIVAIDAAKVSSAYLIWLVDEMARQPEASGTKL